MKSKIFYKLLVVGGIMLWVGETIYFGGNMTAQSGTEKVLDQISLIAVSWGIMGDILSTVQIHKHESNHYDIHTDKIVFGDGGKAVLREVVDEKEKRDKQELTDRLSGKGDKK